MGRDGIRDENTNWDVLCTCTNSTKGCKHYVLLICTKKGKEIGGWVEKRQGNEDF